MGVDAARVNERHDIILEAPSIDGRKLVPYKISGSAYKLTRNRALHHGTLLQHTPVWSIGKYLHSPAAPYIKARGVESVRSVVGNLMSYKHAKTRSRPRLAIIEEFASLYQIGLPMPYPDLEILEREDDEVSWNVNCLHVGDGWVMGQFPKGTWLPSDIPEFKQGLDELRVCFTSLVKI